MRRIRRLTAVTLSFVLIAGMCLPVLADETKESPADPEAAVSLDEAADETDAPEAAALPEEEAADASVWAPGQESGKNQHGNSPHQAPGLRLRQHAHIIEPRRV